MKLQNPTRIRGGVLIEAMIAFTLLVSALSGVAYWTSNIHSKLLGQTLGVYVALTSLFLDSSYTQASFTQETSSGGGSDEPDYCRKLAKIQDGLSAADQIKALMSGGRPSTGPFGICARLAGVPQSSMDVLGVLIQDDDAPRLTGRFVKSDPLDPGRPCIVPDPICTQLFSSYMGTMSLGGGHGGGEGAGAELIGAARDGLLFVPQDANGLRPDLLQASATAILSSPSVTMTADGMGNYPPG